ncbi:hypothetical protein J6590_003413 [Homalodisca vitripennis]|nr:hypothetical protein J6590_003413 [Homalodisca vitripennis]
MLISSPQSSTPAQKCRRKETWERLRRRQSMSSRAQTLATKSDPWVRRDSFKTSPGSLLESSSDPDLTLPRPRAVRPNCLPLPLQTFHSPATSTEALPSPSASLQLSPTPLVAELGNKSSSAPILTKQLPVPGTPKADESKKRVLKQPRSQSERHLTDREPEGRSCPGRSELPPPRVAAASRRAATGLDAGDLVPQGRSFLRKSL